MDLIDKLPYFYDNGITRPIIEAEQIERDILFNQIKETLNQMFVETATWGLDYWEEMLQLPNNYTKTYKERRSIIYSKLRGLKTSTIELVKALVSSFFGIESVQIYEDNSNYIFYIEMVNAVFGNDESLSGFIETIELHKPAHLNYGFIFTCKGNIIIQTECREARSLLPICGIYVSYGE